MFNIKHWPHYFSYRLNHEVREVYWHGLLNSIALSLVFIFEPIYLYSLGYSLTEIMWFYAQVYLWYMILISFGAKFASRFGYKHSIFVSNICYVAYWFVLLLLRANPVLFFVAPVLFALQKSWFWPAYDADIALSSVKKQRGREMGALFSLIQISFIAGPFFGGLISDKFGFVPLFIAASFLMLFSAYPLFGSPEVYSRHRFRFKNLLEIIRKRPANFFGYWGYAEDLMLMSLWPIYIFIVVPNFFSVGLVSTIATVIGTMLMLYIGRLTDRSDKRKIIRVSSVFYGLTWFVRFFGQGVGSVLALDTATKAGKDILSVPMTALTYERASEKKGQKKADYAIAYSVFYEFSLSVGKFLTALAAIAILSSGGSMFTIFALVGVLTMFYGLLK